MRNLRSVSAGGKDKAKDVAAEAYQELASKFSSKLYWFLTRNDAYRPHEWQASFHAANDGEKLKSFRHLVAGRRGGKTLSAAWEVLFYCLHPEEFHWDAHRENKARPLWVWVLAKDHKVGFPAAQAIREALDACGLVHNKDYKWNKTDKHIEFENGTLLQFKTADDPQSLRGAGLDILWVDEAAFVPTREAWDVVRPALADKEGILITTTTPKGKNWFYEEFFQGHAMKDELQFRVEYTSLDNPYFKKARWAYEKATMHPSVFKQEYMAAFDAMAGLTLSGEWLHYYVTANPDEARGEVGLPRRQDGSINLHKYIGVDVSTGEADDEFAIALIGLSESREQAFLLDFWKGKIQFPEQVDKLREWHLKYTPDVIGVESNAYQRSLAQVVSRFEGLPPVAAVMSKGKKNDRIISMGPLFKIGKVRIYSKQVEFIDQWVSFDGTRKDNRDDLLDAVEIALGCAGVMLPSMVYEAEEKENKHTLQDEAREQIEGLKDKVRSHHSLGIEA